VWIFFPKDVYEVWPLRYVLLEEPFTVRQNSRAIKF